MLRLLLFSLTLFLVLDASADSPLTSIKFHAVAKDHPLVKKALISSGQINQEMIDFLLDKGNPVATKLCIINALGYKVSSTDNSRAFLQAIQLVKGVQSVYKLEKSEEHAELMICYAYLMAMESYFDVRKAQDIVNRAQRYAPENFAVAFVAALLHAQRVQQDDFCEVYVSMNRLRKMTNYNLPEEIFKNATDYTDLYLSYCN